jgi:carbon-monoxide dehydrogenase large subunit
VRLIHGDTGLTPYATGTYASRAMIMNGGAAAEGCARLLDRLRPLAAHLLQCRAEDVSFAEGRAHGPSGASAGFAEIARLWYLTPNDLPAGLNVGGLEVSVGWRPEDDRGAFSFSTHVAVVEVDTGLGDVRLRDYVVAHDCGTRVNPLIVDGQIIGGTVQGIGTALFEESRYDAEGQPLSVTLGDYLLPGAPEMPPIRLVHTETPSPRTRFGEKGVGEGGAIAPPAAIVNAVNDALRPFGAEVSGVPVTPDRVLDALDRAARGPA